MKYNLKLIAAFCCAPLLAVATEPIAGELSVQWTIQATPPISILPEIFISNEPRAGVMVYASGGILTHYAATVRFERLGQIESRTFFFENHPNSTGLSAGAIYFAQFPGDFRVRSIFVQDIRVGSAKLIEVQGR